MKDIVVLYHGGCTDGFSAAWAASKKFKDNATYMAIDFAAPVVTGLEKKELYLLDFCYPPEIMRRLLVANEKVVVIDHHITARQTVEISTDHVYDLNHSGCVLTWKYFFPKKPVPKFLDYVEGQDLWNWDLPSSRELMASLRIREQDFKVWDKLIRDFEDKEKRKKYAEEGKIILKYQDSLVQKSFQHMEKVNINGEEAYVVNSPFMASEIGSRIAKEKNAIGIIWYYNKGKLVVSLRSRDKIDVSELAKKYGGGGHKHSSGFTEDFNGEFPWIR